MHHFESITKPALCYVEIWRRTWQLSSLQVIVSNGSCRSLHECSVQRRSHQKRVIFDSIPSSRAAHLAAYRSAIVSVITLQASIYAAKPTSYDTLQNCRSSINVKLSSKSPQRPASQSAHVIQQ